MVPLWVMESGVSSNAVSLFGWLGAKYADRDDASCKVLRQTLATDKGWSLATVDRALKELATVRAMDVVAQFDPKWGQVASIYVLRYAKPVEEDPLVTSDDPPSSDETRAPHQECEGPLVTGDGHTHNQLPSDLSGPEEPEGSLSDPRSCNRDPDHPITPQTAAKVINYETASQPFATEHFCARCSKAIEYPCYDEKTRRAYCPFCDEVLQKVGEGALPP